jgi:hypothetical protein
LRFGDKQDSFRARHLICASGGETMDRKRADRRRLLWMLVGAIIGVIVVALWDGLWVNHGG